MREARIDTPMRSVGVPQRFLNHASRSEIHAHLGLTAADLVTSIISWVGRPTNGPGAVNLAVRRKQRTGTGRRGEHAEREPTW